MKNYIPVARAADVPEGRGLRLVLNGRELALFQVEGQFYIIDGLCPHKGGPLSEGYLENGRVYCPLHGWEYDLKTGGCAEHPHKPVACHPTRVVDGQVQVQLANLQEPQL
jgi:nitrite reductase (NADH) small subunit